MAEPLFDVILLHNSADKAEVRAIRDELRRRGIEPWFDEDRILPGRRVRPAIERGLTSAPAVAILLGSRGEGPVQRLEIDAAIFAFNERGAPVIPVLLSAFSGDVPPLLKPFAPVDFRRHVPDPMDQLIAGITGTKITRIDDRVANRVPSNAVTIDDNREDSRLDWFDLDRTQQWADVRTVLGEGGLRWIFFGGAYGEAHDSFVDRLRRRAQPGVVVASVQWPDGRPPRTRRESLAMFSQALVGREVDTTQLVSALVERIRHRMLLVVHSTVHLEAFRDRLPHLRDYYARWIPDLIDEANIQVVEKPGSGLTLVQPLMWARRRLSSCGSGARLASRLLDQVRRARECAMLNVRVTRLPDLSPVGRADLEYFLPQLNVADPKRFIDCALAKRSTEDVLAYLRNTLPREAM